MRGEGRFEDAMILFETCCSSVGLSEPKRFLVNSAVADLHCELAYRTDTRSSHLARAVGLVELEVRRLEQTHVD